MLHLPAVPAHQNRSGRLPPTPCKHCCGQRDDVRLAVLKLLPSQDSLDLFASCLSPGSLLGREAISFRAEACVVLASSASWQRPPALAQIGE